VAAAPVIAPPAQYAGVLRALRASKRRLQEC
jgi:hypothetical protein